MVTFTTLSDINSQIAKLYLDLWLVICYYVLQRKVEQVLCWSSPPNWSASALAEHLDGVLPHGGGTRLDPRCAVARHGPSRELGPCPKELDGLSCMHQLFPGREPHQLYFVVLERGMLCKSIRNRCSCRTVSATRRFPGLLTVPSSSVNGARPYSG